MQETGTTARRPVFDTVPPPFAPPANDRTRDTTLDHPPVVVLPPALEAQPPGAPNPVVLVDPRPWSVQTVRSLRARGATVVALSGQRLEPALHSRGVEPHLLPALALQPERWSARLLELAARLEPRPAVFACSRAAAAFLEQERAHLEPHLNLANLQPHVSSFTTIAPDAALRQALLRGEAALEVQMVRDAHGIRTGVCVLAWAPGAPPDVLVTSVEGVEVVSRSEDFLTARRYRGYARLVWAPDRFGRLALQAASPLAGASLTLARADGIDFAAIEYAAATGRSVVAQRSQCTLVRRLPLFEPLGGHDDTPIVDVPLALAPKDPLPWFAGWIRALVHS